MVTANDTFYLVGEYALEDDLESQLKHPRHLLQRQTPDWSLLSANWLVIYRTHRPGRIRWCISASRLRRFHLDLFQEARIENKMASEPAATVADLDFDNEQYDSAEDEDFQLDPDQEDADLTGSDSDDETTEPAAKRRKTGPNKAATEDKELDSGDEAMIQKVKARKEGKQKVKKLQGTASAEDEDDVDFDDDDEGGPGGFVRTRAMRMRM
jgi:hypothetical protein